jgi:general secretion pathway protein M
MKQRPTLRRLLTTPIFAAGSYVCLLMIMLFVIGSSVSGTLHRRSEIAGLRTIKEQLEARKPTAGGGHDASIAAPAGSPCLEGSTVTVAAAALLQRVTAAITKFGGNVLSSQVDLQGTQSKTGFLTIIASCDIDQPSLQKLLYDLEAGQPFLFLEQLSVQAPASFASAGGGRLRVLLSVSGQWQGAK